MEEDFVPQQYGVEPENNKGWNKKAIWTTVAVLAAVFVCVLFGANIFKIRDIASNFFSVSQKQSVAGVEGVDYVSKEVMVQFKSAAQKQDIDALLQKYDFSVAEEASIGDITIKLLKINGNKDTVTKAINNLKKSKLVEIAEPNYYAYVDDDSNDPAAALNLVSTYELSGPVDKYGININNEARIVSAKNAVVAVMDTGVAYADSAISPSSWEKDNEALQPTAFSTTEEKTHSDYIGFFVPHENIGTGNLNLEFEYNYFPATNGDGESNQNDVCMRIEKKIDDRNSTLVNAYCTMFENTDEDWVKKTVPIPSVFKDKDLEVDFVYLAKEAEDCNFQVRNIKITQGGKTIYPNTVPYPASVEGYYKKLSKGTFVEGHDFVYKDNIANDDYGHGTLMTSLIQTVAPDVKIMPVKVLGELKKNSKDSNVLLALAYLLEKNSNGEKTDVVNMSFGGARKNELLESLINTLSQAGIVFVGAAGNDNKDSLGYPAQYDDSVIAVGGISSSGTKDANSNYGQSLDLVAPISPSISSFNTARYARTFYSQGNLNAAELSSGYVGTSGAAAEVSGIVALMKATNPSLTPIQVKYILQNTAYDLGEPGWDKLYGCGLVNAGAAVSMAQDIKNGVSSLPDLAKSKFADNFCQAHCEGTKCVGGPATKDGQATCVMGSDVYNCGHAGCMLDGGKAKCVFIMPGRSQIADECSEKGEETTVSGKKINTDVYGCNHCEDGKCVPGAPTSVAFGGKLAQFFESKFGKKDGNPCNPNKDDHDSDCLSDYVCYKGKCMDKDDAPEKTGKDCDPESTNCEKFYCNDKNQCVDGIENPGAYGKSCADDPTICDKNYCDELTQKCKPDGRGKECTDSKECVAKCDNKGQCTTEGKGVPCGPDYLSKMIPCPTRCTDDEKCTTEGTGDLCVNPSQCKKTCNSKEQCVVGGGGIECGKDPEVCKKTYCNDMQRCVVGGNGKECVLTKANADTVCKKRCVGGDCIVSADTTAFECKTKGECSATVKRCTASGECKNVVKTTFTAPGFSEPAGWDVGERYEESYGDVCTDSSQCKPKCSADGTCSPLGKGRECPNGAKDCKKTYCDTATQTCTKEGTGKECNPYNINSEFQYTDCIKTCKNLKCEDGYNGPVSCDSDSGCQLGCTETGQCQPGGKLGECTTSLNCGQTCGADGTCKVGGGGQACSVSAKDKDAAKCGKTYCNEENQCTVGGKGKECTKPEDCSRHCLPNGACGYGGTGEPCDEENTCQLRCNSKGQCSYDGTGDRCTDPYGNSCDTRCTPDGKCEYGIKSSEGSVCYPERENACGQARCDNNGKCSKEWGGDSWRQICSEDKPCTTKCNEDGQCKWNAHGMECDGDKGSKTPNQCVTHCNYTTKKCTYDAHGATCSDTATINECDTRCDSKGDCVAFKPTESDEYGADCDPRMGKCEILRCVISGTNKGKCAYNGTGASCINNPSACVIENDELCNCPQPQSTGELTCSDNNEIVLEKFEKFTCDLQCKPKVSGTYMIAREYCDPSKECRLDAYGNGYCDEKDESGSEDGNNSDTTTGGGSDGGGGETTGGGDDGGGGDETVEQNSCDCTWSQQYQQVAGGPWCVYNPENTLYQEFDIVERYYDNCECVNGQAVWSTRTGIIDYCWDAKNHPEGCPYDCSGAQSYENKQQSFTADFMFAAMSFTKSVLIEMFAK